MFSSNTPSRPPSLSVPTTQNTAPILEFQCLYTHDIRRKSKRWQDGFLRFHTFNKRIMVYDVPRNYVGDTHWRDSGGLADGDELQLDRGGLLVQVGEAVGRTEQDLSGLLDGRRKDREERAKTRTQQASSPISPPAVQTPHTGRHDMPAPLSEAPPRTLNALLGTPRGPLGRALLPQRSPFEQKTRKERRENAERPPKKRRVGESVTGSLNAANLREKHQQSSMVAQRGSSIEPSTRPEQNSRREVIDVPRGRPVTPSAPPLHPRQSTKKPPKSAISSAASGFPNPDIQGTSHPTTDIPIPALSPSPRSSVPPLAPPTTSLRLAARPTRKKLLCQDLASVRPHPPPDRVSCSSPPPRQALRSPPAHGGSSTKDDRQSNRDGSTTLPVDSNENDQRQESRKTSRMKPPPEAGIQSPSIPPRISPAVTSSPEQTTTSTANVASAVRSEDNPPLDTLSKSPGPLNATRLTQTESPHQLGPPQAIHANLPSNLPTNSHFKPPPFPPHNPLRDPTPSNPQSNSIPHPNVDLPSNDLPRLPPQPALPAFSNPKPKNPPPSKSKSKPPIHSAAERSLRATISADTLPTTAQAPQIESLHAESCSGIRAPPSPSNFFPGITGMTTVMAQLTTPRELMGNVTDQAIGGKGKSRNYDEMDGGMACDVGPWSREAFDLFSWRRPGPG
ncbi:MAG: hypothetical protein M1817_000892 [Caeruleum heppii]|nr:MAG: hypothetical protein M1817_000892 [Caeruleum heppii]